MATSIDKKSYRDRFSVALDSALVNLTEDQIRELRERLKKMIDYGIGRVDYYERSRSLYQTLGMAFVGAGIAFSAAIVANFGKIPSSAAILFISSAATMVFAGARLVSKFLKDTSPHYPYRSIAHIRSWYFKYNLTYKGTPKATPPQNELPELVEEHAAQFEKYIGEWVQHARDARNLLLEDIEQVFILFALQYYKQQFTRQMAAAMVSYLRAIILLLLGGLIILTISKLFESYWFWIFQWALS